MEINLLKKKVKKSLGIILGKPLLLPTSEEMPFLSELKNTFLNMPVFEITNALPSEAAWLNNMNRLRELVLNQDPREFLRWDVVSNTMFISFAPYIYTELKYLMHNANWDTRCRPAIIESSIGHPIPYLFYQASTSGRK